MQTLKYYIINGSTLYYWYLQRKYRYSPTRTPKSSSNPKKRIVFSVFFSLETIGRIIHVRVLVVFLFSTNSFLIMILMMIEKEGQFRCCWTSSSFHVVFTLLFLSFLCLCFFFLLVRVESTKITVLAILLSVVMFICYWTWKQITIN